MKMQKLKYFPEGLFFLLAVMLPAQHALAGDDQKTPSRSDMRIVATRGTYLFSTGNIDQPDMIFTPDFVRHEQQYLTPESKLENISNLIEKQRKVYEVENIQTEPLDVIVDVEGQRAAVRWSADVTRLPTANVADAPEFMRFEGVTISRFVNGKIAEQWVFYDANLVLTLTRLGLKDYMKGSPPPE